MRGRDQHARWVEGPARVLASIIGLLGFVAPAHAQLREITGQASVLGEWELTATVAEQGAGGTKEFVGPLSLKHVGICTVDGPEEKKGGAAAALVRHVDPRNSDIAD
jgi:hypothetical protein